MVKIKPASSEIEIDSDTEEIINEFVDSFSPLEKGTIFIIEDRRTGALFTECHVKASFIVELGTTDVALDPENQPDLRANRDIVEDHAAYQRMREDAEQGRVFSNLVCEFNPESEPPLQVIGGQHRFESIQTALSNDVDEFHGIKVYFGLNTDQRLDVQVISNTNIAVSSDLLDRMYEQVSGPDLRNWAISVGLLDKDEDFSDKKARSKPVTVSEVRTFIVNFYKGRSVEFGDFQNSETTPIIVKSGVQNPTEWQKVKEEHSNWTKDKNLSKAAKEFVRLDDAQYESILDGAPRKNRADYAAKAQNTAVLSSWAFVAGILTGNAVRLKRHFSLADVIKTDPLNASVLAQGKHSTDSDNYRGLGFRTDAKERGRFVEIFWLQAEKGEGIKKSLVNAGIAQFHAKEAVLAANKAKEKM